MIPSQSVAIGGTVGNVGRCGHRVFCWGRTPVRHVVDCLRCGEQLKLIRDIPTTGFASSPMNLHKNHPKIVHCLCNSISTRKTATLPRCAFCLSSEPRSNLCFGEGETLLELLQTTIRDIQWQRRSVRPSPGHLIHGIKKSTPIDICNNAPSFSPERGLV